MKNKLVYIILFCVIGANAQAPKTLGYTIENDSIIFTFDSRDYTEYRNDFTGEQLQLKDFDLRQVAVSGEFNNWSKDNWKMVKVNKHIYKLKKSLNDFNDEFSWQFKFVVNDKLWAEPNDDVINIVPAKNPYGQDLFVYNLNFYSARPDSHGNVTFRLPGYKEASSVILSGSFNKWDENLFKMKKTVTGWKLTLKLNPDIYQYKFIVDGEWIIDPTNPSKTKNEFDGYNSVIEVLSETTFILDGFNNASEVYLSGSFNDWDEQTLCMKKNEKDKWSITIPLSGGKHHYKFIVDGEWIVDPKNPIQEYDEDGNINSVKMVR